MVYGFDPINQSIIPNHVGRQSTQQGSEMLFSANSGEVISKWTILQACLQSLGTAAVMASAGFYLARRGLLTSAHSKGLAKISMNLTIPCLLYSTFVDCKQNHSSEPCPRVEDNIAAGWPLLILPFVNVGTGILIGLILTTIMRPPENFRRAAIAAVAFGNSTGMPITLLAVIHSSLGSKTDIGLANPILYLSVYLLMYPVLTWGLGASLMGVNNSRQEQILISEPHLQPILAASEDHADSVEAPLLQPLGGGMHHKAGSWHSDLVRHALEQAHDFTSAVLQPPVVASIIGVLVAVSPLRSLVVDTYDRNSDCAPFQFMTDGIARMGQAAVPINMMILGASLSKGADWQTLPLRLNLAIAFAKLVVMPAVGLVTATLLKQVFTQASASLYLVVVVVTCTPTANNLMVMAELGNQNKEALATCIFTQYMLSPLCLTASVWLAVTLSVS